VNTIKVEYDPRTDSLVYWNGKTYVTISGGGGGFNPSTIAGYDSTKTQYLSHDSGGVAQWVAASGGGADNILGLSATYSAISAQSITPHAGVTLGAVESAFLSR
jgi:hypothetical protein